MEDMFTITPVANTVELIPGTIYQGSITVAVPAQATEPFSYTVQTTALNIAEDNIDLITASERTQIVDWLTLDNTEGTVSPNERATINYTITVPQDATPGGQYAAIVVGSKPDESSDSDISVENIFEIGSMIYARVSGELTHSGSITKNEFPGFIVETPFNIIAGFENNGNIHETAVTTITIRDIITNRTVYPTGESSSAIEDIIMPSTTREVNHQIEGFGQLGIYEVTQSIEYLGETSSETHTVFLCPIWLMLLVFMVIACLVMAIVGLVKKHRRKYYVV